MSPSTPLTRRTARAAGISALALVAALTVTACSSDDDTTADGGGQQTATQETEPAGDTTDSDGTGEESTDATTEAPDPGEAESAVEAGVDPNDLGEPVGTYEVGAAGASDPEVKMRAEVFPLQREGDILTLVIRWTLDADEEGERGAFRALVGQASGLGPVTLVDPVNLRQHRIVEAGGRKISTDDLVLYESGQTRYWSAVFAAPPEDVTEMTVLFPGLPAIADVPIR